MDKINTINELYKRLTPALKMKSDEVNKLCKSRLNNIDIWNYLIDNKWKNKKDLRLYELVSDILDSDNIEIIEYTRKMDVKNAL
jgi:hypothetical protein